MTVNYNATVSTSSFRAFMRILFKWKGSIWKAVYHELAVYMSIHVIIAAIYRYVMTEKQQRVFESVCWFLYEESSFIPLTFLLGFFVSQVMERWWTQFNNIGWIDSVALTVVTLIDGTDEKTRILRRAIIRHLLAFQVIVYRDICSSIRRRFPTLDTLVIAGYLTADEKEAFVEAPSQYRKYWIPIKWTLSVVKRARLAGCIPSYHSIRELHQKILDFRGNMGMLLNHDMVPLPLLYTQVVTFTVRLFFLVEIFRRQPLERDAEGEVYNHPTAQYLHYVIFTLQFIFYMGWIKVAEAMLNPFGNDDDDFEINFLIDRNLEVGFLCVDGEYEPELVKDQFWDEAIPEPLYSMDCDDATVNGVMVASTQHNTDRRMSSMMVTKRSFSGVLPQAKDSKPSPLRNRKTNVIAPAPCELPKTMADASTSPPPVPKPKRGMSKLTVVDELDEDDHANSEP